MKNITAISLEEMTDAETGSEEGNLSNVIGNQHDMNQRGGTSAEKKNQKQFGLIRVRNVPKWFRISTMLRTFTHDHSYLIRTMNGGDKRARNKATSSELNTLQWMGC